MFSPSHLHHAKVFTLRFTCCWLTSVVVLHFTDGVRDHSHCWPVFELWRIKQTHTNDIYEDTELRKQTKNFFGMLQIKLTQIHTSHPLGQLIEVVCGPVRRGFRVDFIVQRSIHWLSVMLSVRGEREVSRSWQSVLTVDDWGKRGILGQWQEGSWRCLYYHILFLQSCPIRPVNKRVKN